MKTSKNNYYLKALAITFAASGVWDLIAGFMYFFAIGDGRIIDQPNTHPFYAVFLGSFFLCFAYLQWMSAFNIRLYAFNVGCLIIGRLFYFIQLYAFMAFEQNFPSTFWFTGIIDGIFTMLYVIFAIGAGMGFRELFLPVKDTIR
ncbi:MAG: hypothetical protein Q7J34_14425 [Bacteroidales bacterium]|jgi:hypothetical protein|nr:hypothetical protein [Bacteroidales bacterium]